MGKILKFKKGAKVKISKHFYSYEFDCKCKDPNCNFTLIDLEHVELLEQLRTIIGCPIIITCGYRCPKHNAEITGSAKDSQHTYGTATDITITQKSLEELYQLALKINFKGIGKYKTFIHVDSRSGSTARWIG